jgi:biotin synthase-like enzyme
MTKVGVLQGTYLGIYIGRTCQFWSAKPALNCRFCATGLNVGVTEEADKTVDDVVETALAAKEESGVTFVHFNSGDQGGGGLETAAPYVKAIKERVGALVGVQVLPSRELWKYDWLIDLGADHFSFCYEFQNPSVFAEICPGKATTLGQKAFFDAMEYCARKMGAGRNSGEIIAGIEPLEDTLRAIDYITGAGCFPTVCIFRPIAGTAMQDAPSPKYEDIVAVMRHVFESCMRRGLPIGMAPNIEVSLIVNPDDARYLSPPSLKKSLYEAKLKLAKSVLKPLFKKKMRPRPVAESAERYSKAPA